MSKPAEPLCAVCDPPPVQVVISLSCPPPEFPRTSLLWLPAPKTEKKSMNLPPNQKMWVDGLRTIKDEVFQLYSLVEVCVPPLLARKYHVVNVTELMKNGEDRKFYGVAAWFVMWCQAFGAEYLHTAQKRYEALKLIHRDERQNNSDESIMKQVIALRKWRSDVGELLIIIGNAKKMPTAPTLKDNTQKAGDFLLEPCIIIQLPWNIVLFHQWLVAALNEVLIFEKNAIELRHWPYPKEIEECAQDLLVIIKQLKEKIILGFAMLSRQVTVHPQVEAHQAGWVLEEVILPSLAALQFLISGKAYGVLKSIKKIAWSSHGCKKERVYMPVCKYTMHEHLTDISSQFFYSFPCLNLTFQAPFPLPKINIIGVWKVIQELKYNIAKPKKSNDDSRKDLSVGEECAFNFSSVKIPDGLNIDERISLTLSTIKDLLIDAGRIKPSEYQNISKLLSEIDRKLIDKLFYRDNKTEVKMMVLHTMMYWQFNAMIQLSDQANTVWSRVIVLQLEILQREQIMRIANLICLVSTNQDYPLATKLDKIPPMSVEAMSQVLEEVRNKRERQNRDWLWSQFAAEWRKPVNVQEPPLLMSFGVPSIVKACEGRIGRLVFNIARNSYSIYEKGGELYPHWQTIQYILPCFVASFVDFMRTSKNTSNQSEAMLKFLHSALEFYENSFEKWRKKIIPRKNVTKAIVPTMGDCAYIHEMIMLCQEYRDQNHMLQSYYTQSKFDIDSPENQYPDVSNPFKGFEELNDGLLEWPLDVIEPTYSYLAVYHLMTAWLEKSFQIQMNIHEISINAWKPIMPGSPMYSEICEPFSELHQAYCILNILCVLFQIYLRYHPHNCYASEPKYINDANEKMITWYWNRKIRYDFYRYAVSIGSTKKINLLEFVKENTDQMIELYNALKKFRQSVPTVIKPKFILENISRNTPELKLACKYYLNNDFKSLDKMVPILCNKEDDSKIAIDSSTQKPEVKQPSRKRGHDGTQVKTEESSSSTSDSNSQTESDPDKSVKKDTERPSMLHKHCRNCSKKERRRGSFIICEQCVEQNYPDVNYFCNKRCKEKWWKEEHMAEHLEFELGLLDFSHLNLK